MDLVLTYHMEDETMRCTRCQGMMVREIENRWFGVGHIEEGGGELRRCVNCGNVEDQMILCNRRSCGAQLVGADRKMSLVPA